MSVRFLTVPATLVLLALVSLQTARADHEWVVYDGFDGPGNGKHIVLISGDDEYRSEEALPQLGKILAKRHGFKCTVLFAVDPATGEIKPDHQTNIPGLEALESADLVVLFTRFRNLPDEQMKYFDAYVKAGKPIVAMRTSTHAFNIPDDATYASYSWRSKQWDGGFGRQVLGETWISHHGRHGKQSTRGIIAEGMESHPILTGIESGSIWGPTDVYGVRLPLPGDSKPLLLGAVLEGMSPDDEPVDGKQNDPMMPIAWTKSYQMPGGKAGKTFTTTMGASQDLQNESLRRMLVNACYWALDMTDQIPEKANVDIVGEYRPTPFGFGSYQKGMRPEDHLLNGGEQN
ncbi:ThuA domain-containing protein [Maioricimonas sp. JC845]|uniref:ThuA domain-containing protein n=1 Tax=Maioricimonas sp. JC845 TaxID=3232138 RepID=UPI0034576A17